MTARRASDSATTQASRRCAAHSSPGPKDGEQGAGRQLGVLQQDCGQALDRVDQRARSKAPDTTMRVAPKSQSPPMGDRSASRPRPRSHASDLSSSTPASTDRRTDSGAPVSKLAPGAAPATQTPSPQATDSHRPRRHHRGSGARSSAPIAIWTQMARPLAGTGAPQPRAPPAAPGGGHRGEPAAAATNMRGSAGPTMAGDHCSHSIPGPCRSRCRVCSLMPPRSPLAPTRAPPPRSAAPLPHGEKCAHGGDGDLPRRTERQKATRPEGRVATSGRQASGGRPASWATSRRTSAGAKSSVASPTVSSSRCR